MTDSDLMFRSAGELAGMVRSGEISSRELVQVSLDRIEALNPELNAFVEIDGERDPGRQARNRREHVGPRHVDEIVATAGREPRDLVDKGR